MHQHINRECRKALLEAYEGTEIFGFGFPYELPERRGDREYENPEELECAELEWIENKEIIAWEFTLKLPDGDYYLAKNRHLKGLIDRKRRAIARLIITRCFKSYDINAHGGGCTPLTSATTWGEGGEEELLRLLCQRTDVLVNKQGVGGYTALYEATITGYVRWMRILLDVGRADVDGLDILSSTPLHWAAWMGRLEGATLVIERGARVNLVDDRGETPLDSAHQAIKNRTEMIAVLKSKGAKQASELPQPST